ncbi:hypothetical protein DKX38_008861 [Salix brachista]|uniref:NADH-ubiquinone oxidoreductase 21kDa subunit N-terminal domain-containing protein n=1 Tax=Salix brachista TaxID=2182728 RepID=A0A5N5M963_9ROSI|nr:hypothetical protein DKX38_008861 [Salix brachista]
MNTDITASAKPEYPVIDRNPAFTKVVGNFNTLDYCRFITLTGVSVTVGYLSGIKPGIKGPSMVTGGLIGLMGGFMYAYQNSAGRLMGFFPNESEVARYQKRVDCHVIFVGSKDRNWQIWLSHVLRERYYCVDFLAKLGSSQADSVLVEWLFPHFIHWSVSDTALWDLNLSAKSKSYCVAMQYGGCDCWSCQLANRNQCLLSCNRVRSSRVENLVGPRGNEVSSSRGESAAKAPLPRTYNQNLKLLD